MPMPVPMAQEVSTVFHSPLKAPLLGITDWCSSVFSWVILSLRPFTWASSSATAKSPIMVGRLESPVANI